MITFRAHAMDLEAIRPSVTPRDLDQIIQNSNVFQPSPYQAC